MPTVVYVILGILALLLIAYIFVPKAMLKYAEKNIIFQPPPSQKGTPSYANEISQEYMIDFTNKGRMEQINVLYAPSSYQKCNQTVIYCHGNASDLHRQQEIVDFYHRQDISVLVWDYPGYGKSTGNASYETLEKGVLAVYDWFKMHFGGQRVIVHGMSLGGAAAAYLASKRKVQGLILESTFLSVASAFTKGIRYSLFDEFCNDRCLRHVPNDVPVLIIHSLYDDVISVDNSKMLYKRLMKNKARKRDNTSLIIVKDGNHFNARYSELFWPEFNYLFACF